MLLFVLKVWFMCVSIYILQPKKIRKKDVWCFMLKPCALVSYWLCAAAGASNNELAQCWKMPNWEIFTFIFCYPAALCWMWYGYVAGYNSGANIPTMLRYCQHVILVMEQLECWQMVLSQWGIFALLMIKRAVFCSATMLFSLPHGYITRRYGRILGKRHGEVLHKALITNNLSPCLRSLLNNQLTDFCDTWWKYPL